jgi:hypothetical protein
MQLVPELNTTVTTNSMKTSAMLETLQISNLKESLLDSDSRNENSVETVC